MSRSIDDEEFELQRKGYAAAVTSPQFVQAIQSGAHGAVALSFIEWAGPGQQALVAKWMVIRDGEGATDFAKMLLAAPRSFAGRTAIGDGIDFAASQLAISGLTATRRVIDVSGDGTNNSGRPVTAARDDATAKGSPSTGLPSSTRRPAASRVPSSMDIPIRRMACRPITMTTSSAVPAPLCFRSSNFDTFAQAMTNKLLTEISDATPHLLRERAAPVDAETQSDRVAALTRHVRACAGHSRLKCSKDEDVDGRDKPGHDAEEAVRAASPACVRESDYFAYLPPVCGCAGPRAPFPCAAAAWCAPRCA